MSLRPDVKMGMYMLLRFPNEYAKVSSYRDIIHRQDFIVDLLTWALMDEMMSRHI